LREFEADQRTRRVLREFEADPENPSQTRPRSPYRNPHPPLRQSPRPRAGGKYKKGRWVKLQDGSPALGAALCPGLGEILGSCERGFQEEVAAQSKRNGDATTEKRHRPELYYEWVPDDCDLIPWSEEAFCTALRGRDTMLAGDSPNDHWHASLYYLLGGRKDIYKREGTI
jgi:hypothetical protein